MYFPPEAFPKLAKAEKDYWWFIARNKLILWVLATKVPSFNAFFEIGCGTGFVLEAIAKQWPKCCISGGEYYPEAFVFAQQRVPHAHFRQCDLTTLCETNTHELIGCCDVLEHIENDGLALSNLANALTKTGYALLTVPQHRWLWSDTDTQACHVRRYTREELFAKLNAVNLHIVYATSFVSFLLPLMLVSRLRKRRNDDVFNEFSLPSWLNKLFLFVMDFERFFIRLGIRFPFGGSLLCLAQKR